MIAGVYIDDAGTPGERSQSTFLHPQRKSWASVIVPEGRASDVAKALMIFLHGVKDDYCAEELHFTDIYSGRKEFKSVSISERYELIQLMVKIFVSFQLPIFFQTLSPDYLNELEKRAKLEGHIGYLNLSNHEHLSLLFLLFQVKDFILKKKKYFPNPIPVYVDEGIVKAGTILEIPFYKGIFLDGKIRHSKSHEMPFLQLADFAAFAVARTQWLAAGGKLKERDKWFLKMISPLCRNIMNLPLFCFDPEKHSTEDYDRFLIEDRRAKGLKDYPWK